MKTVLKILLPLIVLGTTAGVVALLVANKREIKPEPVVEVAPVVEVVSVIAAPHRFTVRSQGEVAARTEIDLVAEVPGKIVWVAEGFAEGGFFRAGDSLVRLDSRDFELAVTQSRSAIAQAQVALEREQAEANVARKEWERLGKGVANPLLLRKPQLAQAVAALSSAEASLVKAKLDLSRCEVTAPFDGRVRRKQVDVGQFTNRGAPVARIYAIDYVEICVPIPMSELDYLELGINRHTNGVQPSVTVTARLGGSHASWPGRLVRTAGEIHPQTRMLTGIVRVDDPYGVHGAGHAKPLPVGLFVDAAIEGRQVDAVYRVPRSAMRGRDQLTVVDAEDRIRFRSVAVVRLLQGEALLKTGLSEGDRVCISLLDAPVDGMKVDPRVTEQSE